MSRLTKVDLPMNLSMLEILPALLSSGASASTEEQLRAHVQMAVGCWNSAGCGERRVNKRHPYPYPIYLTPVAEDGRTAIGEAIVVLGKHLSQRGLDFYYREPVPFRRVIASLPCGQNHWVGLLLDLTWCRFARHGWYDNGGRFLSVVPSPLHAASASA